MTETKEADAKPVDPGKEPRVVYMRGQGRWVVDSRDLARVTAHQHFNITGAVRKVEKMPGMRGEFFLWSDSPHYPTRRPVYYIGRAGLVQVFSRLHGVPECRDMQAVLAKYLRQFELVEHADPADDAELAAMAQEPAGGVFDAVKPAADGPPSWKINAAIVTLREAAAPGYVLSDLENWNRARCEALAASIYATEPR